MDLRLPEPPARYRSASQRARVATEAWAAANVPCHMCESDSLGELPANTPVSDLHCQSCGNHVQLKASRHRCRIITNSAYEKKAEAFRSRTLPDYLLLHYDADRWAVRSLSVLASHFITPDRVSARKPLRATAERPGWVGSTIDLRGLPHDALIPVIVDGQVRPVEEVRTTYARFIGLRRKPLTSSAWMRDVLTHVRTLAPIIGTRFTLQELYQQARADLCARHPNNRHVDDKIRQQLQVLRDVGVLAFESRGVYRLMA